MLLEKIQGLLPEIEPGSDPKLLHFSGRRGSDAVKCPYRQCLDKGRPHFGGDDEESIRFIVV